jgi:hypothetical protein
MLLDQMPEDETLESGEKVRCAGKACPYPAGASGYCARCAPVHWQERIAAMEREVTEIKAQTARRKRKQRMKPKLDWPDMARRWRAGVERIRAAW